MKINLIAAIDNKKRIAVDGKIPWHIPEDLSRFKEITMGHAVIMGRKTWESLPSKPLFDRTNIVVTSRESIPVKVLFGRTNIVVSSKLQDDAFIVNNLNNALVQANYKQCSKAFIIGGAQLYQEALPLVHRVYLTRVTYDEPGENARITSINGFKLVTYDEPSEDEVFFPWNDMWEWNWELKECQLRKGYRFEVWEKAE